MTRWRRSLRFETTAIIVVGILLSQLVFLTIYASDRRDALRMTEAVDLAERAAGLSHLLADLPPGMRPEVATLSDSRAFRVWLSRSPALGVADVSRDEGEILVYFRAQFPDMPDQDARIRLVDEIQHFPAPAFDSSVKRVGSPIRAVDYVEQGPGVAISVQQADGGWLNFLGQLDTARAVPLQHFLANAISAIGLALVAFWLVARVTRPLSDLSAAAERLGRNLLDKPLALDGPREVAVAADAFNRMQARLLGLIHRRTDFLAAISHDLRTPLTQIRLRLELTPPSPARERNLKALDDMTATIATFLSYAGASHGSEDISKVDIGTLIASICDDLADCGAEVAYHVDGRVVARCKRLALKRAVTNLIDNAMRYGHRATVSVGREHDIAVVRVDDEGPGIPLDLQETVLRPFQRGPAREGNGTASTGTGLGLAIAQAVAEDHGGEIRLSNRPGRGLTAELRIPAD